MASADEVRAEFASSRQKLRTAIEGASGSWETGSDDAWGARKAAEHCIGSEPFFMGMVVEAMQGTAPGPTEPSYESSADAVAGLDSAGEACDKVLRYVEDRDLTKAVKMPDGVPFESTVEGAIKFAAYHLDDHATQIASL